MIEKHTRGSVHLGDNHPLGPVDHKRPVFCHQGNVPDVNLLFLNVADRADPCVLIQIPHHQTQGQTQRARKGNPALLTFLHIILGRVKVIRHIFQLGPIGIIRDGKNGLKHLVQADPQTLSVGDIHLQKMGTRIPLHLNQVRHVHNLGDFSKTLTKTFARSERSSHTGKHSLKITTKREGGTGPNRSRKRKTHRTQRARLSKR